MLVQNSVVLKFIRLIYVQASLDGQVRGTPLGQRDVEPNAEEERKARYVVRSIKMTPR
jgi:hypothetical protein